MEYDSKIPAGYKAITAEVKDQQLSNPFTGSNAVILKVGEIIEPNALICSEEPVFTNDKGEKFHSVRLHSKSNIKPSRLLTLRHFNVFPKNRLEFLGQTRFGQDVLDFQGTNYDFAEWLCTKKLIVKSVEKLDCRRYIDNKLQDTQSYFHLFEYAE